MAYVMLYLQINAYAMLHAMCLFCTANTEAELFLTSEKSLKTLRKDVMHMIRWMVIVEPEIGLNGIATHSTWIRLEFWILPIRTERLCVIKAIFGPMVLHVIP